LAVTASLMFSIFSFGVAINEVVPWSRLKTLSAVKRFLEWAVQHVSNKEILLFRKNVSLCGRYLYTFRIWESSCSVARHRLGTSDFDCLSYRIAEYSCWHWKARHGERRLFTLAFFLIPCVFYVHVASECHEVRLKCWYLQYRLICTADIEQCWKYKRLLRLAVWHICEKRCYKTYLTD